MCVSPQSGKTPLHLAAERAFFVQLVVGTDDLYVVKVEEVPRWRALLLSGGDGGWITFADSSSESHELKVEEGDIVTVVSLGDNSWCGENTYDHSGITADFTFPVDAATRVSHEGVVTSLLASKASVAIVSKVGRGKRHLDTLFYSLLLFSPPSFSLCTLCSMAQRDPSNESPPKH